MTLFYVFTWSWFFIRKSFDENSIKLQLYSLRRPLGGTLMLKIGILRLLGKLFFQTANRKGPQEQRTLDKTSMDKTSQHLFSVWWCFVHVCLVQVTILNIVWRSRRAEAPRCAQFSTDRYLLCDPRRCDNSRKVHPNCGAFAHWERHTLSLGRNKHGWNITTPLCLVRQSF